MEFLKNNLFYVLLVVGVILISVPSHILGSQRSRRVIKAQSKADQELGKLETTVKKMTLVSEDAIKAAEEYNISFKEKLNVVKQRMKKAGEHLDYDFLIAPKKREGVPDAEDYRTVFTTEYNKLAQRIADADLKKGRENPLPLSPVDAEIPTAKHIRILQKRYWITKELVDAFVDPECGIKSVGLIEVDNYLNAAAASNSPDGAGRFWRYPINLEFEIDIRRYPIFLHRLLNNENVTFYVDMVRIDRDFREDRQVYVPTVSVEIYATVRDYISTEFEKEQLKIFKDNKKKTAAAAKKRDKGKRNRR